MRRIKALRLPLLLFLGTIGVFWLTSFWIHPPVGYQVKWGLSLLSPIVPEDVESMDYVVRSKKQLAQIGIPARVVLYCGCGQILWDSDMETSPPLSSRKPIDVALAEYWIPVQDFRISGSTGQMVCCGAKQMAMDYVVEVQTPVPQEELWWSVHWHWCFAGFGAIVGGIVVFIYWNKKTARVVS